VVPSESDAPARQPWWSSTWFKLGLSAVLLGVLLYKTDLSDLGDAVAHAQLGWVTVALIGYIVSQFISSIRWTMLARPLGFNQPFVHFFTAYFTGMYMNLFAPSTVAGDIGRALLLAGGQQRKALAFTTVLADRGLGFVTLSWIGAVAVLTQPGYTIPAPLYYAAWTVPAGTLFAWLCLPQLMVRMFKRGNRWRLLVERDLAPYWKDVRLLVSTSAVAVVFHTLQVLTQVLLAHALGLRVPLSFFFIFVPVVNILGMVPVSFSGIGVREGGYWFFLAQVGVTRSAALALGLLSSAVVLATGLVAGLVFLVSKPPLLRQPQAPHAAGGTR